jgi:hypothetical protein
MALDSAIAVPSSNCSAGTAPVGLIARNSACWPCPSNMLTIFWCKVAQGDLGADVPSRHSGKAGDHTE